MAAPKDERLRLTDGQFSWTGGVQSDTPRTKKIPGVLEEGVDANQLAWAINASVRGGGIGQRPVLQPLVQGAPWSGVFQGAFLYQPDFTDPILLLAIGGRIYRIRVDTDNSVADLSANFGLTMPPDQEQFFFAQAEMFAVIQAGDFTTLPLFYDFGTEGVRPESMRRSNGLVNPGVSSVLNEIPAAGPMDYYANRLWYAFGRGYAGGDICSNNTSGAAAWDFRNSVLKLTENPVAYGGDAFIVPTVAGNIRALAHACNLDSALGESQLYVFTRRNVYACTAPITRDDWTKATLNLSPLQKLAVDKGGAYSGRCVVPVNGDLFFQSPPNGDIRSVQTSLRYFGQWGQVPLSANENRLLQFNDRSMLRFASGIQFDNRLLETALPIQTPAGVAYQAVIPLDFDTISTFQERKPPAWEGVWDFSAGPYILQLVEGDFGGRERAFAVVWSVVRQQIEVWELRSDLRFEAGENRVKRSLEFPAMAFGDPFALKELDSAELWLDKILGTVDLEVFYRPDAYACWIPWHAMQICAAKDCREDPDAPCLPGYPMEPWCEQDAIPITLPRPAHPPCIPGHSRPANWGFQFQMKVLVNGWARVRGLIMYALPRGRPPYSNIICGKFVKLGTTELVLPPPAWPDPFPTIVHLLGIDSGEAFGLPTVVSGPVTADVDLTGEGIASGEAFGLPVVTVTVTPPDITGLVAWWKADHFTGTLSDGDPVGAGGVEWHDETGNGHDAAQGTAGQRPLFKTGIFNGGTMPAVRFDGTDDQLDFTAVGPLSNWTIIIVYKHLSATPGNHAMWLGQTADGGTIQFRSGFSNNNELVHYRGGTVFTSSTFASALTTLRLASYVCEATGGTQDVSFRENKTPRPVAPVNNVSGAVTVSRMGGIALSPTYNIGADIAEICIYNDHLTSTQLDQLFDTYFQPKWGI